MPINPVTALWTLVWLCGLTAWAFVAITHIVSARVGRRMRALGQVSVAKGTSGQLTSVQTSDSDSAGRGSKT